MVLRTSFVYSLCFLLLSCSESDKSQSVDTLKKLDDPMAVAEELYSFNCTACHGTDGSLGASGAKDLTKSTLGDKELIKLISEGKNGMPPMKDLLGSMENVQRVSEYVKSLRK